MTESNLQVTLVTMAEGQMLANALELCVHLEIF
jgi:hypothetical protein